LGYKAGRIGRPPANSVYLAAPPSRTPAIPIAHPQAQHSSDRRVAAHPRPRGRRPHPGTRGCPLPHGSARAGSQSPAGVCGPRPHRGVWGGVPPQRTVGRESERSSLNRNKWSPSPGGRARGTTRSDPGGVGQFRFYSKAYPARRLACRRWSDQPVKELQHIWVRSEQTFRRIVCRYRIFLAGRYWRGWRQGLRGSVGAVRGSGGAARAGVPSG